MSGRGFLARLSSRLAALLRRVAKALERLNGTRDDNLAELAVRFPNAPEHWLRDLAARVDDPAKLALVAAGERAAAPAARPAIPRRPPARTFDAPPSRPAAEKPPRPDLRVLPPRPRKIPDAPSSPLPHARERPADVQSPPRERASRPDDTTPLKTEQRAPRADAKAPTANRRPRLTVVARRNERRRIAQAPDGSESGLRAPIAEPESETPRETRPVEHPAPKPRPARTVLAYVQAALRRMPRPTLASLQARPPKRASEAGVAQRPARAPHDAAPRTAVPIPLHAPAVELAPAPRAVPPDAFAPSPRPARAAAGLAEARTGRAALHGSNGRWPALPDDAAPDSHIEPPRLSELRREQEHGLWSA